MGGEITKLDGSGGLEPMGPVPASPSAQGQSTGRNGEGKARRRPPAQEEISPGPVEADASNADQLTPDSAEQHQIDSLA